MSAPDAPIPAAVHTQAGREAERAGDLEAALGHFRAALARQPGSAAVLLDTARALLALGHLDEAEPLLRRTLTLLPGQPRALRDLARIASARGDHDAAAALLDAAVAGSPEEINLRIGHAEALRAAGRLDAAEAAYAGARALAPGDARVDRGLVLLGRDRAKARPPAVAAPPVPKPAPAPLAPPTPAEARAAAADAERAGDPARALSLLDAALAAAPGHPGLLIDRARVLLALGRVAEAGAGFEAALLRTPHQPRAVLGLARIAQMAGDTGAAVARLQAAVAAGTQEMRIPLELARLLRQAGQADAAAAAFEAARRISPEDARPLLGLAALAQAAGDTDGALAQLAAAEPLTRDDPAPRLQRVRLLAELGRLEEAAQLCEEALTRHAGEPRLLLLRGTLARQRGDAPAALEALRAAAAAGGDRGVALGAASEMQDLGEAEEAERMLAGALRGEAADAMLWVKLGLAGRAARGEGDAATLRCFLRATELDPTHVPALLEASREQLALGQFAAAEDSLRRALHRDPDGAETLRGAIHMLRVTGDRESALALVDRLRAERPEAGWVLDSAYELQTRIGRWGEALEVLDAIEARSGPRASVAANRASILERQGDTPAAAHLLAEARARWPDDARLWWQQVEFWLRHGPLPEAAAALAAPPAFAERAQARLVGLRGRLAEAEWRLEDAAALYAESLRLRPGEVWVQDRRARMLLLLNDPAAALAVLKDQTRRRAGTERLVGRIARPWRSMVGRLTTEYLLDADLLAALRGLDALPAPGRLPRLAAIARDWPDHTAPALATLIALRRAGLFQPAAEPGASAIPWRITQYWDQPTPPGDVQALMGSWTALNPGFAYARFDSAGARAYLRANYPPTVALAFHRGENAAQKADIFRLAVLLREGGFYADADDRCLRPLDGLLRRETACVMFQEEIGAVGNNFIGVAPGHPLIAEALRQAVTATNRGDRSSPWLDTGPGLLSRCVVAHLLQAGRAPEEVARGISMLSHVEIRGTVSIHCALAYKRTPLNWQLGTGARPRARVAEDIRALVRLTEPGAG